MTSVQESETFDALVRGTILRFHNDAVAEVDLFVDGIRTGFADRPNVVHERSDERLLASAAEFALLDQIPEICRIGPHRAEGWLKEPVIVAVDHVFLAELKSDCFIAWTHEWPPQLVDVVVASADVARISRVLPKQQEDVDVLEDILSAVHQIERAHARHPLPAFQALAKSKLIRMQAVLWCVQFSIFGHPGISGSVSEVVGESVAKLEIRP